MQPRPGLGTFVTRTLGGDEAVATSQPLRADLIAWLEKARGAGLDDESIEALFWTTFRDHRRAGSKESVT